MLKYNYGGKSMKILFAIYADTQSLFKRIDTCHNDPKKSSTAKRNKNNASGYSLITRRSFNSNKCEHFIAKKFDYYMKNFCKDLREHVMKMTNFERLKLLPLAKKEIKSYHKQKPLLYMLK